MTTAEALALARTGLTVWLVDTGTGPSLTTRIPCGRTPAYSLGRWPPDALPTHDELAADIAAGLQQLSRLNRRAA